MKPGTVYLVGAGPGDPGLLTVRGRDLLERADAVVYDALANPILLEGQPAAARLYDVGKRAGAHARTQPEINRLLVELADRHEIVVRLKGGDPYVFGRGGEEAEALASAGVPFEVVPGVTAGVAGPAYAGIPVTHRGLASSVSLVTGHEDPEKRESGLDWSRLARVAGTLVVYMGAGRLRENVRSLIDGGRDPATPAAIIEWATYPRQRTIVGDLASLPGLAETAGVEAPALVVVGEVVRLREKLSWFERRPLFGMRILVTRARAQASALSAELQALGAEVIQFPTIRIHPAADPAPLRAAAREVERFDWVVFTSQNGVVHFWDALREVGRDTRALAGVSVCAIGPATATALERHGVRADLVPERFVAESVLEALAASARLDGARVLLPRAEVARSLLPRELRARGAEVVEVAAYRTEPDVEAAEMVRERLRSGGIDLVTFTASSTVNNFVEVLQTDLGGAEVASIGPITSATARERGLPVHVEAAEFTIPGLVGAIAAHCTRRSGTRRES